MVVVPEIFSGSEFERLFILSKISNFTPEELKQYEQSIKNMNDYYNIIDTAAEEAEKRGRAEGRAEGIEIGRNEGVEEGFRKANMGTAKNLKQLGVSVDIIAQSTGLSPEVVEAL